MTEEIMSHALYDDNIQGILWASKQIIIESSGELKGLDGTVVGYVSFCTYVYVYEGRNSKIILGFIFLACKRE